MRTASRLGPCGYADVLGASRVRSPRSLRAMGVGTEFHALAHHTLGGGPDPGEVSRLARSWLPAMASTWAAPGDASWEMPIGLSPTGTYVAVNEPEPHKYVPQDTAATLLTAGRADFVWSESDRSVAVVGDIKTGRFAPTHPRTNPQLWALGLGYADSIGAGGLRVGLYYARTGQYDWWPSETGAIDLDSAEAGERWEEVRTYASLDAEPRPGEWCHSCWERSACSAAPSDTTGRPVWQISRMK